MKFNLLRLLLTLIIIFAVDLYVFQAVKTVSSGLGNIPKRWLYIFYWLITALIFAVIISANFKDWHSWPKYIKTYGFAILMMFFVLKILVLPFLVLDDIIRV